MSSRRSPKRRGSPRIPGSGTAHHKNTTLKRAAKEKGGQDEGPKTEAQELVERFGDEKLGDNALKKVRAIFDGKEKTSQKELSELVSALMDVVEGENYNNRIRAIDFIVKFFGSRDIDNDAKKEILQKADENREIPILTSLINAMKDEEFDIRFYATRIIVEAVKNELIEDEITYSVRLGLGSASVSDSPIIQAAAMEGIEILKAREPVKEVEEIEAPEKVEGSAVEEIEEIKEVPEVESEKVPPAEEPVEEESAAEEAPAIEESEEIEEVPEEPPEEVEAVEKEEEIVDTAQEDNAKVDEPHDKKQHQMPLHHLVLLEDLKKGNAPVRIKALQNIQKIIKRDDPSVFIPEIIELLDDKHVDVRIEADSALKAIGKPAIPALIGVLNNTNPDTRYEAVWTLGNFRDDSATPALINVLINDDGESVRRAVIEALGKIAMANPNTKSIGIIFALVSALEDKEGDVRKNTVEALGEILENGATKHSRQLIREALDVASKDKDPEVRAAVKATNNRGHVI